MKRASSLEGSPKSNAIRSLGGFGGHSRRVSLFGEAKEIVRPDGGPPS
jgi:hypothetical protein